MLINDYNLVNLKMIAKRLPVVFIRTSRFYTNQPAKEVTFKQYSLMSEYNGKDIVV